MSMLDVRIFKLQTSQNYILSKREDEMLRSFAMLPADPNALPCKIIPQAHQPLVLYCIDPFGSPGSPGRVGEIRSIYTISTCSGFENGVPELKRCKHLFQSFQDV